MANKKVNEKETTKKTTSSNKKTTTKKVAPKTSTAKKTTTKSATTKKTNVKKVVPTKVEKAKNVEPKVVSEKVKQNKKEEKFSLIEWAKNNINIVGGIIIILLLLINIIIVSNGHKAKLSNGKEVIASIKGKEVTADELFDSIKEKYGSDSLLNIIDEYIINKELTDDEKLEAKKTAQENINSIREQYESAGYKWEDVLTQYGYDSEDTLLNEFLVSAEKDLIANNYLKDQLTDDEINKYYENNVYGKYTAKHILITPETSDNEEENTANEEAAKAKAQEVIDRLNNGEDWATLVSEYSDDEGSVEDEGLVENFTYGDVVDEFWNATEKLNDGEYTQEPVKSSYGYHIIYRVSHTDKKALKDIKNDVVDKIVQNKLSEDSTLYTNVWAKIRKKYKLTINDSIIKKVYENSTK